MININVNAGAGLTRINSGTDLNKAKSGEQTSGFGQTVKTELSKINDVQQSSDMSMMDLLSGRNEDITSVVSQVAKADMSFKLLVGVRNKLIEAYKQTMSMPL
jgi:flagellar hook-basal body complex protein FliE